MRSHDVAQHFGVDGPLCLRRLAYLVHAGKLVRPWYGFYAPPGLVAERPLPRRHAEILAVLNEPRTVAEIGALIGVTYSVTHILQSMMVAGHIIHCGKYHYLHADLAGRFEPIQHYPQRGLCHRGASPAQVKAHVLSRLSKPMTKAELAAALGERSDRTSYFLCSLMKQGKVVRSDTPGKPVRYALAPGLRPGRQAPRR